MLELWNKTNRVCILKEILIGSVGIQKRHNGEIKHDLYLGQSRTPTTTLLACIIGVYVTKREARDIQGEARGERERSLSLFPSHLVLHTRAN